ncbi:MAG: glycerol-3-phosphate dehydrogenase [Bdellovibrionales bacterium]|nr:glycerol-3-phosphate dehydrogenase [Bdellovibrionales bacterium]
MAKLREADVLVIGGGVNGAGIARDLAGRGLSVVLCEKDDLASATSSASTKLIHGGLRYLEYYEFGLVRDALKEREVLLRSAPHIIWPLTFILPHHAKLRPWWLIRMGLFLYDYIGGKRSLPASRGLDLMGTRFGQPLKNTFKRGFSYSDCWVEDTRLVVLAALDAAEKGATIMTRTECTHLVKRDKHPGWTATLHDHRSDENFKIHAHMVVNAAGPWVNKALDIVGTGGDTVVQKYKIRWVKGSHIIVPKLYQGDHAYILQNGDGRIVFAIPYEKKYTLIGTTDVEYKDDIEEVRITMEEVEYLCNAVSQWTRKTVKPEDVQWTYSGVRPLLDDGASDAKAVTRDYVLDLEEFKEAPILSVYGGKITTFRKLAEKAGDQVVERLGRGRGAWTAEAVLPGAEASGMNFETFVKTLRREFNWLPEALALRLARAYGSRVRTILRGCKRMSDMGEDFGDGIYEAEVRYLVLFEWAMTADDILWRRSKLGLHVSEETQKRVAKFVRKILPAPKAKS